MIAPAAGRARLRPTPSDLTAIAALVLLALAFFFSGERAAPPAAADLALILAVDVSGSMAADDETPSRLDRARAEIRLLLDALPGARFALLPFAGEAVLQMPLTADREALSFFLERLSTTTLPPSGSAPQEAVGTARRLLEGVEGRQGVVLFSDGERTAALPPPPLPPGAPLYVVGLGSASGTALPDAQGRPRRDRAGRPILTRCDRQNLARLAREGGGRVIAADAGGWTAPALLEVLGGAPRRPERSGSLLFLAGALVLLLARQALSCLPRRHLAGALLVAVLAALGACGAEQRSPAMAPFRTAGEDVSRQEFAAAARGFAAAAAQLSGSDQGIALYNQGTALLHAEQACQGLAPLEQALLLLPGDKAVRRNFALALRRCGGAPLPGAGAGGTSPEDDGNGLTREQALQLLEAVRPEPGAPLAGARTTATPVPPRDW